MHFLRSGRALAFIVSLVLAVESHAATARVRHAPILNGDIVGSIQQMSPEGVALNNAASITGDLLVPGTPTIEINGSPTYAGTEIGSGGLSPSDYTVTLNSGCAIRHVVTRTDAVALPNVQLPESPTGTRSVTVKNPGGSIGDPATLRDLTLTTNVGEAAVPPGRYGDFTANRGSGFILGVAGAAVPSVYHFQSLAFSSGSQLRVVGPVIVRVALGFLNSGVLGSEAAPEWLKLEIHTGGLTINAGAVYGFVTGTSATGAVTINRKTTLVGGVACDRLTVNSGGLVQLTAEPATVPPSVSFEPFPVEVGLAAPVTADVAVLATAATGSAIEKVELFMGSTKIGEATVPTTPPARYVFTVALSDPGTFVLTARATDTAGIQGETAEPLALMVRARLPYTANFEAGEGYAVGAMAGQLGWNVTSGSARVTNATANTGSQSVIIDADPTSSHLEQTFGLAAERTIFSDFYARVTPLSSPDTNTNFDADGARFGFMDDGANVVLRAFNGDGLGGGSWTLTGYSHASIGAGEEQGWVRLTTRTDFVHKTWDLYAEGRMVAANLGLRDATRQSLGSFSVDGSAIASTSLDDLFVGWPHPLFEDANDDGIDDAWETAHGLSLTTDNRDLSPSGSGTTVIESYVAGTDPNDFFGGKIPVLTVVSGDNQTATAGQFNAEPFDLAVWDSGATYPLVNAPVTFTVTEGGGLLATSPSEAAQRVTSITLRTDPDGTAQLYYQQPPEAGVSSKVTATAGGASTTFSTTSAVDLADSDDDGLPDEWELRYFGGLGYGPGDDPGEIGLALLESYQQGTNPWPVADVSVGLRAWFSSRKGVMIDGNIRVQSWADLSGNGFNLVQSLASAEPTITTIGGNALPIVAFDGASWLKSQRSGAMETGDVTVIAVLRPGAVPIEHAFVAGMDGLWSAGPAIELIGGTVDRYGLVGSAAEGTVQGEASALKLSTSDLQIVAYVKSGATLSTYLNGAIQGIEPSAEYLVGTDRLLSVGAANEGEFGYRGEIAEFRIYSRALTRSEQRQIIDALTDRYAITIPPVPDADGDGLSDDEEVLLGTDVNSADHPDVQLVVVEPADRSAAP